jgi:hypothetical protein
MPAHPHFNPPADTVEVAGDPSWRWDGRRWLHNGRHSSPHSGTTLQGKAGTSFAGWSYNWSNHTWNEPDHPFALPPASAAAAAPAIHVHAPAPVVHHPNEGEHHMCEQCSHHHNHAVKEPGLWNGYLKHPVIPTAGAIAMIASYFVQRPTRPPIDQNTDPATAQLWNSIYEENNAIYRDAREDWNNAGQGLLTIGAAQMTISQNEVQQIKQIAESFGNRRSRTP